MNLVKNLLFDFISGLFDFECCLEDYFVYMSLPFDKEIHDDFFNNLNTRVYYDNFSLEEKLEFNFEKFWKQISLD